MEKINSLLLAEFYTATGYFDRLLFAFSELGKLHQLPRGKVQIQKMLEDTANFFERELRAFDVEKNEIEPKDYKKTLKFFNQYIESTIKLPFKSEAFNRLALNYINHIYRHCYELHNYINETTQFEVQLPRIGLIEEEEIPSINNNNQIERTPLFFIDEQKISRYVEETIKKNSTISFLNIKREEKYDSFIQKGHMAIASNNFEEAKANFYLARNYQETAEVLTLIAWTYSLLDDRTKAKEYCMQAVQKDPQYGPAYNDFGNYLLSEGQIHESLRWFELAKRAINYQNREFPYINAGRAYVMLKDFEQAINEFSLALTLAPHHHELHETVAKLKNSIAGQVSFTPNKNPKAHRDFPTV